MASVSYENYNLLVNVSIIDSDSQVDRRGLPQAQVRHGRHGYHLYILQLQRARGSIACQCSI